MILPTNRGVVFTASAAAIGNNAYVDVTTHNPPAAAGIICLVTESKDLWKNGVKGLVTKHASEITQALSAEDMRRDSKRLRITDMDTTANPPRAEAAETEE